MTDQPEVKAEPKRQIRATSLADLASGQIDAVLDYGDYELVVPIKVPSMHEWNRLGFEVAIPMPPTSGAAVWR